MLNIKLRTLQSWRGQGKSPPYIKIGEKLIRYRTSDVYRWLDEQTLKVQNLNRT
ncbi:helix-turn-helix transcriptional regulator [Bdellovibrio sp.]|uniref:helix-turn-helix transcriptional regulator n=1 Tax=Bdellovibrio sp. TaxID=28201 RepID=UPI0039E566C7